MVVSHDHIRRCNEGRKVGCMESDSKSAKGSPTSSQPVREPAGGAPPAFNIPNCITLGRVLLVPFVFWLLLSGRYQTAFFIFVIAGLSDAVDGWLAKRYHWETELGAYLDPLADKLLIVSIFVAMGWQGELPSWLVIAVVSRDLLIVTGVMLAWVLEQPVNIRPLIVSKANTFAQLLLAAVVLADTGFDLGQWMPRLALVWITLALTLASLWAYTVIWLRHMTGEPPVQSDD